MGGGIVIGVVYNFCVGLGVGLFGWFDVGVCCGGWIFFWDDRLLLMLYWCVLVVRGVVEGWFLFDFIWRGVGVILFLFGCCWLFVVLVSGWSWGVCCRCWCLGWLWNLFVWCWFGCIDLGYGYDLGCWGVSYWCCGIG